MVNLRLNPRAFFRLTILFLALVIPVFAQENGGGRSSLSPGPYQVGEHLTYNVAFSNFSSAAHVDLQIVSRGMYAGRDALLVRGHVETTGVVNVALFAINNDYTTYFDPETGIPFHAQQTIREGAHATDIPIDFNQSSAAIASSGKQAVLPGVYDFLSAFYRLRTLPLVDGATYNFVVRGGEDYQTELKISGHEVVKNNVGSFNAIVGQVRIANNSVVNGYRIKVYFSDDERHVPLRVTARVKSGELRADLAGSEIITPSGPVSSPTTTPVVPAPSPTPPRQPVQTAGNEDWPFRIGEQLNFQVFLANSNTPVGLANFEVRGRSRYFDRDGLQLNVKAQTTGAAARLFVASDVISSYLDPKSLLPYRTELNLAEGNRRVNRILTINQDYGTATTNTGQRLEIPVGTHDYLSFLYALRTFSLNPPKRNAISILVENKPKTLFISSLKREIIELGTQKISTIALSLTTDDPQSDKYQLRMWISDDRRRLPLRITAVTELGALRADLVILPATSQ